MNHKSSEPSKLKNVLSIVGGILLLQVVGALFVVFGEATKYGFVSILEKIPHIEEIFIASMAALLAVGAGTSSYYYGGRFQASKKNLFKAIVVFLTIAFLFSRASLIIADYPAGLIAGAFIVLFVPYSIGFSKKKKEEESELRKQRDEIDSLKKMMKQGL